jgi:hypothetical protein
VATQTRLFGADRRRSPRIRRGLDDTLKAMRTLGRVESIDAALIALARVTADELDAACADGDESRYTRGTLVARYHDVLTHLLARPDAAATTDDQLAELFAAMADPPPG